jgi:hypothetical protein
MLNSVILQRGPIFNHQHKYFYLDMPMVDLEYVRIKITNIVGYLVRC